MDNPLDEYILSAVKTASRNYQRGVLPRMVQPLLPVTLSEQRVRLYMVRLWKSGKLIRIGAVAGANRTRQGYRVPNPVEMRLEQDLFAVLDSSPCGIKLGEVQARLMLEVDVIEDYLLQMEAAGRLAMQRFDMWLNARSEVILLRQTERPLIAA